MKSSPTIVLACCVMFSTAACKKNAASGETKGPEAAPLVEADNQRGPARNTIAGKGRKLVKDFCQAYREACEAPVSQREFHMDRLKRLLNVIECEPDLVGQYYSTGDLDTALADYAAAVAAAGDGGEVAAPPKESPVAYAVVDDSVLGADAKLGMSRSFISKASKMRDRVAAGLKVPELYNYEVTQLEKSTERARAEYWKSKGLPAGPDSGFAENHPLDLSSSAEPLSLLLDYADRVLDSSGMACIPLGGADLYMVTMYHRGLQKTYSFYIVAKLEIPDEWLPHGGLGLSED